MCAWYAGTSVASKKGSTGLEWLLREADKPAAEPARERRAPQPDPGVPVPPSEEKPEPWQVQPVTEIRAPAPAVLDTPPKGSATVAPSTKSGRDNRVHPRAPVACEVRYKKGGEQIVAKGRNVSMGGFFVETTKYLPTGDVFQAQIVFPDETGGAKRLAVIAEVIWATAGDPGDLAKFPPGMGAKFLDVDDTDKPFLKSKIDAALGG